MDHPGNLGGSDSWEDAGQWQHRRGTPRYPDELRERAVKMVLEIRERDGKGHGEIARVARQLDVHPEALRSWLQAWLASLDADQLIALGSRDADDGIESLEWAQGGWRLVFEAYPLLPDRRGPGGRIIGTGRPAEARIIDDVTP